MKYSKDKDKRFHSDIVGALKRAFRNDNVIPEHKNDGSPDILREYLKKRYSSYGGPVSNDYTYNVLTFGFTAAGGLILTFNVTIGTSNGKADKELSFSWSQLTTFLRNNMDEVFPTKGPADSPTYLDVLLSSDRYEGLTPEHFIYQNEYCPYDLIDFYAAPDFADDNCLSKNEPERVCEKCRECWTSTHGRLKETELDSDYTKEQIIEAHEKYMKEHQPQLPASAEETAVTFNYAVLSAELGDYLRRKEQQLKNEYMNFTANCGAIFAEAQERLAKHGFGENNGLFEKWIASMGFKRDTVYRMINVYNFRSSQIATNDEAALFDGLSKSLQYEVAKPSAPPELVEQVMSGDITTHKDYITLKKQLEEAKADRSKLSSKYDEVAEKNFQLEKQIIELNSRPVDVAVKPDTAAIEKRDAEIERLKKELSEAQNSGGGSDEQLSEFYELLHDKARSALKDCVSFITSGLPDETKKKFTVKFHNFSSLLEIYYDDLEV